MTRKVDPATLVAYLDGELKPSVAGEVEAALVGNAELRARLASLERVDAALAAAYDPVLQAPLPALVLTDRLGSGRGAPATRGRPAMRLAWAAGIGGLILGFAAGQYGTYFVQPAAPVAVAVIELATAGDPRVRAQRHHGGVQRPDPGDHRDRQADQHVRQCRRQLLPGVRGPCLGR